MTAKIYGLIRSANRYYYAMGNQALVVQVEPFPAAWRKTPSTSWKPAHGQLQLLRLDMLGFGILELDPLAEFDRSSVNVFRLHSSNGKFEYEPDWDDGIPFTEWTDKNDWREIVSDLMSEIDPGVLKKLREFSHFHLKILEALHGRQGFEDLLDNNPVLAACLAGRIRVGAQVGERRSPLNYRNLLGRSEREIAAAVGFGDSEEVVSILKKIPPDVCKPHDLASLADLIENPVARKTLIAAEAISHPALLLLRNAYLSRHLTGGFLSDFASAFPHSLDILTCPWGPLLRGGDKGDEFTWRYQQALDVVEFAEDPTINSLEDLKTKHSAIFMQAYNSRYHK
jgi:hypothetical protein